MTAGPTAVLALPPDNGVSSSWLSGAARRQVVCLFAGLVFVVAAGCSARSERSEVLGVGAHFDEGYGRWSLSDRRCDRAVSLSVGLASLRTLRRARAKVAGRRGRFLAAQDGAALRLRRRLVLHGENSRLLVEGAPEMEYKGPRVDNARDEHGWEVPDWLAPKLMKLASGLVQKRRYAYVTAEGIWDLDVFLVSNAGLVIAEFETEKAVQGFTAPAWCGHDVGDVRRFDNEELARHPISEWSGAELARYGVIFDNGGPETS